MHIHDRPVLQRHLRHFCLFWKMVLKVFLTLSPIAGSLCVYSNSLVSVCLEFEKASVMSFVLISCFYPKNMCLYTELRDILIHGSANTFWRDPKNLDLNSCNPHFSWAVVINGKYFHWGILRLLFSDGYSKLGARGKVSQKLVFSKQKRALISYFTYFPQNHGDL